MSDSTQSPGIISKDGYHASSEATFGLGSDIRYGHVKVKEGNGLHINEGEISASIVDENNNGLITSDMYKKIDYIYKASKALFTPEIVDFKDCTDKQLEEILKAHYAGFIDVKDIWSVGDEIPYHLETISTSEKYIDENGEEQTISVNESHTENDYNFIIVDFEHDDLEKINMRKKAALTLCQKENFTNYNPTTGAYSNENGQVIVGNITSYPSNTDWMVSSRRKWCNYIFPQKIPNYFTTNMKSVIKKTSLIYNQIPRNEIDKCFLASFGEITQSTPVSYISIGHGSYRCDEGTIYNFFKTQNNRIYKNLNNVNVDYFTRTNGSPRGGDNSHGVCYITTSGSYNIISIDYGKSFTTSLGIRPFFCL